MEEDGVKYVEKPIYGSESGSGTVGLYPPEIKIWNVPESYEKLYDNVIFPSVRQRLLETGNYVDEQDIPTFTTVEDKYYFGRTYFNVPHRSKKNTTTGNILTKHNDYDDSRGQERNSQKQNTAVCTLSTGESRTLVFTLEYCHVGKNGKRMRHQQMSKLTKRFTLKDSTVFMLHPDDEKWTLTACGKYFYRWKHGVPKNIDKGISVATVFRTTSTHVAKWVHSKTHLLQLSEENKQFLNKKPNFNGNRKDKTIKEDLQRKYPTWDDNYKAIANSREKYMENEGRQINTKIKQYCNAEDSPWFSIK